MQQNYSLPRPTPKKKEAEEKRKLVTPTSIQEAYRVIKGTGCGGWN
jgi:hypothetical protein